MRMGGSCWREVTGKWIPLSQAVETARGEKNAALVRANDSLASLDRQLQFFMPAVPTDSEFALQIKGFQKKTADVAKKAYSGVKAIKAKCEGIQEQRAALRKLFSADSPDGDAIRKQLDNIEGDLAQLDSGSKALQKTEPRLEELVGSSAEEDPEYKKRAQWLRVANLRDTVEQDLKWEAARRAAQGCLEETRAALISLRTKVIETSTTVFSNKINEVWGLLRKDAGASFGRLHIPTPRGKGFKLELEVKAEIDDGSATKEVDALRVFSESQMNVVGIAAFVSRVRLLGQSLLILDDPVQSMDEEHYRSLAAGLLSALCDDGLQVIVLTHSDQFARDVSHAHFTREGYVTLATRYSRRNGCVLDEGNRRVAERLRQAEKLGEEGDLDNAWIRVRTAIERLYLVLRLKNDQKFEPESWRNTTAEEMWNQGVGELIQRADPAAGARLKDILALTVAGAHDKHSRGQTDLNEAAGFIRSLLNPLRVGEG